MYTHISSLAFSGTQTEETSWAIQLTSNVSVDIIGGQLKRQKRVLSLITDVLKQINGRCNGEERVGKNRECGRLKTDDDIVVQERLWSWWVTAGVSGCGLVCSSPACQSASVSSSMIPAYLARKHYSWKSAPNCNSSCWNWNTAKHSLPHCSKKVKK